MPRGRRPLRQATRACAQVNGPHGLSAQRHPCTTSVGGFVGCRPAGNEVSRAATRISNIAWNITVSGNDKLAASNDAMVATWETNSSVGAVPRSISAPSRGAYGNVA